MTTTAPVHPRTGAPPAAVAKARAYARRNHDRFVEDVARLVSIPSVSAQPAHRGDVAAAARWLAGALDRAGMERVEVNPTRGHPVVTADWLRAPGRPTVLVYGHYDVQPVDPLSEWRSPPFKPTVRDGKMYGRGASDDKGQLLVHVKAIESWLASVERLPVNVRCVFEGEEEIGSPNLRPFLDRRRSELRADVAVVSDTRMLSASQPALTYSLRGALSLELAVEGPSTDMHSGSFGGAVEEPAQVLATIVSSLHARDGRVAVPGFYDSVRGVGRAERRAMAATGPSDRDVLSPVGARGRGEPGWSAYERTTVRPAITVSGLTAGYQGPGGKAVIPARAAAKLNVRLVPDQTPDEVERVLRAHISCFARPGRRIVLRRLFGALPAYVDRSHPAFSAAAAAYRSGFGRAPVALRSGGTIPVVRHLQDALGLPVVLMGFGLPDDRMHAPNEKLDLRVFERAVVTSISFLDEVARRVPARAAAGSTRRFGAPPYTRFRP
jgi:acetylornithine deacetylase/succinyl-diaminopimelate desuccinylase-like protein